MQTVRVNASRSYDICIGEGLLDQPPESFEDRIKDRRVMVVSDNKVFALYGERLSRTLSKHCSSFESFVFPHGEASKELPTYEALIKAMNEIPMGRQDLVIALGGGVTGDLAGFAAATYQRGLDFVQIPTTLLAAVDSSVGGKTALNLEGGKNQIGTVFQPVQVICDISLLDTLPEDEYGNGCAEIIKYAMLGSNDLFESIRKTPVKEQYEKVIFECVSMKRDLVEKDEYDTGSRMLLNFGHTIGHAVETVSGYTIPHGRAVAIGMSVITKAASNGGSCKETVYEELTGLLKQYELPCETEYGAEELASAIMKDKKIKADRISVALPERIGKCVMEELPKENIKELLKAGGIQ